MTLLEEKNRGYRSRLYEMTNFCTMKYIPRTRHAIETLIIPLESEKKIQDPKKSTQKHILSIQIEEEPNQKMRKTCIESQPLQTRSILKTGESPHQVKDIKNTSGKDHASNFRPTATEKTCLNEEDKV